MAAARRSLTMLFREGLGAAHTAQMEDVVDQRRQAYEAMQRAMRAEAAQAAQAAAAEVPARCTNPQDAPRDWACASLEVLHLFYHSRAKCGSQRSGSIMHSDNSD